VAAKVATTTSVAVKKASVQATKTPSASSSPNEIHRIENPYNTAPLSFDSINAAARSALVNIYCASNAQGTMKPITGSGVIIDPRGIILTNAHVAQYVLLAQSGRSDLVCQVRTGAPASSKWTPTVLYIPPIWIEQHAKDIANSRAIGTGEHDYALLYISAGIGGMDLPSSYSALGYDSREAIGFINDRVLTASYPVEFVGGSIITSSLYPVTSISSIQQLMTFRTGQADVMSLGGIIQAQKGSSGGVVVNEWGKAIGLVTRTSDGYTTGERDLHAITTAYVDRDLKSLTGKDLQETLSPSPSTSAAAFAETHATRLTQLLIDVILGQ
jgi:hypothetical protein